MGHTYRDGPCPPPIRNSKNPATMNALLAEHPELVDVAFVKWMLGGMGVALATIAGICWHLVRARAKTDTDRIDSLKRQIKRDAEDSKRLIEVCRAMLDKANGGKKVGGKETMDETIELMMKLKERRNR